MADYLFRLKISSKSIFNQYKSSIIMYLIASIMYPIFFSFNIYTFIGMVILFIFDYLSSLVLFLDYYKVNKETEVLIYKKKIVLKIRNETRTINVDEIDQIRIFNSPSRGRSINNAIILIDKFYYVRIRLNNHEDFFLTCLLDQELDYILIEFFPKLIKRDNARIYNSLEKNKSIRYR